MSHGKGFIPLQYFSGWPNILKGNRASRTSGCLVRPFKWRERVKKRQARRRESTMFKYGLCWLSSVEVTGRMRRVLTISGILTVINAHHNGVFWHFNKWQRALTAAVKSWTQLKARDGHRQFVLEYWQLWHANHWRRLFYFIYLIPANNTAPFQLCISILNTN